MAVLFTVCFSFFVVPILAEADIVEELKQKIEQKNEEIKKLEEEARQYRDEIAFTQRTGKTLKEELARIDRQIRKVRQDITLTQKKIEKVRLEIENTSQDIKGKEISLRKMHDGLAGLVQALSEKDTNAVLKILLQDGLVSDFLGEIEHFSSIEEKILGALDSLRTVKQELEVKKTQAQTQKKELENLGEQLKDTRKLQEGVRQERTSVLTLTQSQEKKYQELLRETERKQEEILRSIEELESELRKHIDLDTLPTKRKGFLLWPIAGTLTQGYGETPFTRSNLGRHFYKFHNGIDIKAPVGTPIIAPEDGTVVATGNTDKYCYRGAYGKYIVIDHQNNLATMYAHLSLVKVGDGQGVKKGDIIGYVGNTGLSTGPHLHFTLYDARTVEIKLGKIGTCGLLPFGGSINPLLYL